MQCLTTARVKLVPSSLDMREVWNTHFQHFHRVSSPTPHTNAHAHASKSGANTQSITHKYIRRRNSTFVLRCSLHSLLKSSGHSVLKATLTLTASSTCSTAKKPWWIHMTAPRRRLFFLRVKASKVKMYQYLKKTKRKCFINLEILNWFSLSMSPLFRYCPASLHCGGHFW